MIIGIEQTTTYTELSKYNKMSIEQLQEIFEQRFLDWEHYLDEAKNVLLFLEGFGRVTVIDVLTDYLQDYDDSIKDYYNKNLKKKNEKKKKKGLSLQEIFQNFKLECDNGFIFI